MVLAPYHLSEATDSSVLLLHLLTELGLHVCDSGRRVGTSGHGCVRVLRARYTVIRKLPLGNNLG